MASLEARRLGRHEAPAALEGVADAEVLVRARGCQERWLGEASPLLKVLLQPVLSRRRPRAHVGQFTGQQRRCGKAIPLAASRVRPVHVRLALGGCIVAVVGAVVGCGVDVNGRACLCMCAPTPPQKHTYTCATADRGPSGARECGGGRGRAWVGVGGACGWGGEQALPRAKQRRNA